jgi:hypothetical protein
MEEALRIALAAGIKSTQATSSSSPN